MSCPGWDTACGPEDSRVMGQSCDQIPIQGPSRRKVTAGRLGWTRGRFGVWYTKEVMRVSQDVGLGVGL